MGRPCSGEARQISSGVRERRPAKARAGEPTGDELVPSRATRLTCRERRVEREVEPLGVDTLVRGDLRASEKASAERSKTEARRSTHLATLDGQKAGETGDEAAPGECFRGALFV